MQTQFRFFYLPYLLLLVLSVVLVSVSEHGDVVIWMNGIHSDALNTFFKIWTFGGDGIFYGVIALALLFVNRRYGIVFVIIGVAQGLISAFMKQVLFKGTPRPRKYFEGQEVLDLIAGVKIHDFNSFPSGHTMTAFAVATFLALMTSNKTFKIALLAFAVLVGISRIYLNQHFLVDVAAGSAIGVIIAGATYKVFENYLKNTRTKDLP